MSATSVVEKATSDMLIGPDWSLNLDLCDAINNDPTQAKEVVKAVKKRITNRSPQVQFLALTVLETLIKNCGDHVHQQVAEKDVLPELVKLVKKKADMRVRDKTLVLIDSWKDAFGGSNGRYPQYFVAYNELQKAGFEFPRLAGEPQVPIFTPPQSQPISSPRPPPHGQQSSGPPSTRPDDAANVSGMSLADLKNAQNLAELCNDMVSALNPRDRMSAKEEVIVEIVDQCRILQRRVMQLVNDTSDEELLRQGLTLHDDLQRVLGKYDAFLSGAPLPETPAEDSSQPQAASVEETSILAPKVQTQAAALSPSQGTGSSTRPKGSARTIFPALPPPPSSKKPATQSSSFVSSNPRDTTLDLLSGDPPSDSISSSLGVAGQPQQKKEVDFLSSPAPEDFESPFDSSPFHATPRTEALHPVYPPPTFAETRPENSWSPRAPVAATQTSFNVRSHPTESDPAPPSQPPHVYPHSQPVTATPPPWQEDKQDQQWSGSPPASFPSWTGGNTTKQACNSGQEQPLYSGTGYNAGSPNSSSLGQPSRSVSTGPGDNFGSLYMQQRGSAYGHQSSTSGSSQTGASKPLKSPDTLFNDLVDLRSVNAKFKSASLSNKTSNTSKAGP